MAGPPPITMRVLDSEVGERFPEKDPFDVVVPEHATIDQVVMAILRRAAGREIKRLTLVCHGIGTMVYGDMPTRRKTVSTGSWTEPIIENVRTGETVVLPGNSTTSHPGLAVCNIYGGYGLALGDDILSLENVSVFCNLNGMFTDTGLFEICGCAAADTGPTAGGLTGDGPKLMRALAAAAGVQVRAPIRLQNVIQQLGKIADRTAFIGPTYLFKPNGSEIVETSCW